jgi:hypothetical protein
MGNNMNIYSRISAVEHRIDAPARSARRFCDCGSTMPVIMNCSSSSTSSAPAAEVATPPSTVIVASVERVFAPASKADTC